VDKIALLPGLAALIVMSRSGPEVAFLSVYLPVLLLLPDYFRCVLPGIPDPSFSQSAIFPIALAFFWRSGFRWRLSGLDVLVFAFSAWAVGSEYVNNGYSEAQNLAFDMLTQSVIPYLIGKELFGLKGFETRFARRFVFLLFVVGVASIYQFRMGSNPFKAIFIPFFPSSVAGTWDTQIRWGLGRVDGPFEHSILAGVNFMAAILVNLWLMRSGRWERDFRWLPGFPLNKGRIITAGLVAGSLMTMSRGPWLAGVVGAMLTAAGAARSPKRALAIGAVFVAIGGAAIWGVTKTYTSGSLDSAQTEEQRSATYRAVLLTQYQEIAFQRPLFGWGKNTWPKVSGMFSIDNCYLLMMLMHGLPYVGFFALFMLAVPLRLVRRGLELGPRQRGILFALAGVFISFAISLGTAYMGMQLQALTFLFAGWAEGHVIGGSSLVESEISRHRPARHGFQQVYA
jgi:hypothetical protein